MSWFWANKERGARIHDEDKKQDDIDRGVYYRMRRFYAVIVSFEFGQLSRYRRGQADRDVAFAQTSGVLIQLDRSGSRSDPFVSNGVGNKTVREPDSGGPVAELLCRGGGIAAFLRIIAKGIQ